MGGGPHVAEKASFDEWMARKKERDAERAAQVEGYRAERARAQAERRATEEERLARARSRETAWVPLLQKEERPPPVRRQPPAAGRRSEPVLHHKKKKPLARTAPPLLGLPAPEEQEEQGAATDREGAEGAEAPGQEHETEPPAEVAA